METACSYTQGTSEMDAVLPSEGPAEWGLLVATLRGTSGKDTVCATLRGTSKIDTVATLNVGARKQSQALWKNRNCF